MKKFLIGVFLLIGLVFWFVQSPPASVGKWLQVRRVKAMLKKGKEYYYGKPGEWTAWPEAYTVRGVDVSRYQTHVRWTDVKKDRITFAFIKATEGFYRQDELFEAHWKESGEAGIWRGAYHFFRPGQSASLQALNFISVVNLQAGDLPPVLDVEKLGNESPADLRVQVQDWLDLVEKKYDVKPIIYTNYDFYKEYLAGHFDAYPLWIAHYQVRRLRLKPGPRQKLRFWQMTDRGRVTGIKGRVDCNVFYGTRSELAALRLPE